MRALSALVNHDLFQNQVGLSFFLPVDTCYMDLISVEFTIVSLTHVFQDGMFRCFVRIWRFVPAEPWWFVSCRHCRRMSTPAASSFAHPGEYVCSDVACPCTEATLE